MVRIAVCFAFALTLLNGCTATSKPDERQMPPSEGPGKARPSDTPAGARTGLDAKVYFTC